MKSYICIDIDQVRAELHDILSKKKIIDAQSDVGKMFNSGIDLSYFIVDTYLLRLNGQRYQEGNKDD